MVVAAVAVAVPSLLPDRTDDRSIVATQPPSSAASPSATALSPAALDPQHPWAYRGDPAVIAGTELTTLRTEWATKHPGTTLTPLFGQVYEPSAEPEVVFVSTSQGADRWGVATSSESGWDFPVDQALPFGTKVLMAVLPGDEVPRLLIVAAPTTGQISYAVDGATFRDLPGVDVGVAFQALEGDTSKDVVRVLDGDGDLDHPVFLGPAPDSGARSDGAPTATTPDNLLSWPARGATPDAALLEQATAAFATSLGAKRPDVEAKVLFAGTDKAGRGYVLLQAWIHGNDAHTFGYVQDGAGGGEPFLGPVTDKGPALLAYLVSAAPGQASDTLVILPEPGAGAVSYAASATAPYRTVANGRSDLNGVGVVDRDPRASSDRIRVQLADGSPLFEGAVQPLLCGASSCG
jgi:hypothetical protein